MIHRIYAPASTPTRSSSAEFCENQCFEATAQRQRSPQHMTTRRMACEHLVTLHRADLRQRAHNSAPVFTRSCFAIRQTRHAGWRWNAVLVDAAADFDLVDSLSAVPASGSSHVNGRWGWCVRACASRSGPAERHHGAGESDARRCVAVRPTVQRWQSARRAQRCARSRAFVEKLKRATETRCARQNRLSRAERRPPASARLIATLADERYDRLDGNIMSLPSGFGGLYTSTRRSPEHMFFTLY
jgi:hypothetical protein